MSTVRIDTPTVLDAVARVLADIVGADGYVFSAGETAEIVEAAPEIVPLSDDFTELAMPIVTVALGPWKPALHPGLERLRLTAVCSVWRDRVPLAENVVALYQARDALADAFIDHTKLFVHEPAVQSAVLKGGPGIVPRSIPRGEAASGRGTRLFLTLPFSLDVVCNRAVQPQPA